MNRKQKITLICFLFVIGTAIEAIVFCYNRPQVSSFQISDIEVGSKPKGNIIK